MLILAVEHLFPWQAIFKVRFHPTVNYVLGVLAIDIPLSVMLYAWGRVEIVIAIWCITMAGGATVVGLYMLDFWIHIRSKIEILVRENMVLRPDGSSTEK